MEKQRRWPRIQAKWKLLTFVAVLSWVTLNRCRIISLRIASRFFQYQVSFIEIIWNFYFDEKCVLEKRSNWKLLESVRDRLSKQSPQEFQTAVWKSPRNVHCSSSTSCILRALSTVYIYSVYVLLKANKKEIYFMELFQMTTNDTYGDRSL